MGNIINYVLTGKEKKNFFLYRYYFNTSLFFSFFRIMGGFVIIALGIWFFLKGTSFPILFFSICIIYGLFYILRPFIVLFQKRASFVDSFVSVQIDSKRMEYTEDGQTFLLDFSELISIKEYKMFFVLQFSNKIMVCIPKAKVHEEVFRIFSDLRKSN